LLNDFLLIKRRNIKNLVTKFPLMPDVKELIRIELFHKRTSKPINLEDLEGIINQQFRFKQFRLTYFS